MFQDLRFGVRMLLKKPGFTLIAVLTLALGIGANTAIFSVVNAVLLKPLPYPEADRLVKFWLSAPDKGLPVVDLPEGLFAYFRDRTRTLEKMAVYRKPGFSLTGVGEAERLQGANVTHEFFSILGAQPLYGRTFLPEECTPGKNLVTILSYELWQRRFGGDPAIVGKSVNLNNIATEVVGIMPPGFVFPGKTELWIPVGLNPRMMNCWCFDAIGRLKPGFTPEDVRREMAALSDDFSRERDPQAKGGSIAVARPLLQTIVGEVRTPLLVLLCATGLVLLIACANIANLLLARATARNREIAVRCCLGAGKGRIVRQLLMESLLLALVGAGCGLLVAWWGLHGLKRLPVEDLPRLEHVRIDPSVLLFTLAVTLLTGVLFGLAPALHGARVNLQQALKEGARGAVSASSRGLNHAFVVTQIALSLVLLVGAALLLQSFQLLLAVNPGFRAENVLTARLALPSRKYTEQSRVNDFYQQLLERVRGLPGVKAAGLNVELPFNPGNWQDEFIVRGQEPAPGEPIPVASIRSASPGYLETMNIPLLNGRGFQESDTESAPLVAIVDEKLARKYWPNGDAIGQRIRRGNLNGAANNPWLTIVGIVASVKHASLDEVAHFHLYRPFAQNIQRSTGLVIRTAGDPLAMTRALRQQVAALDPELPLHDVSTMEQAVARSLSIRQLTRLLLTGFAMTALLLAALGIYGVMSLHVSSRTGEFGIRMALGAQTRDVLWLVVRQGALLAVTGTGIGLAAAFALTPLMKKLLFGVSATDPLTFALIAALLTAVALFACYLPARRATKVDPLTALRHE